MLDLHYNDVIMSMTASQITSLTVVYSTVYSGTDQRKHQGSTTLAFVKGIHQWPVNSPHIMLQVFSTIFGAVPNLIDTKVTSNQWTHMSIASKYPSKYQLFHWIDLRLGHKYLETEMLSFWELKFCQWLHQCVKMTSGAGREENLIKMTIFKYI